MNPDLPPRAFLTEFLLEQIAGQPATKALLLYRALAADTKDPALQAACGARADEIEIMLRNHRQMVLAFQLRQIGGDKDGGGSS